MEEGRGSLRSFAGVATFKHQTVLTDSELDRVKSKVGECLKTHESINNRALRELAGITFDQASYFFRRMVEEGILERSGKGSGTRYRASRRSEAMTP